MAKNFRICIVHVWQDHPHIGLANAAFGSWWLSVMYENRRWVFQTKKIQLRFHMHEEYWLVRQSERFIQILFSILVVCLVFFKLSFRRNKGYVINCSLKFCVFIHNCTSKAVNISWNILYTPQMTYRNSPFPHSTFLYWSADK